MVRPGYRAVVGSRGTSTCGNVTVSLRGLEGERQTLVCWGGVRAVTWAKNSADFEEGGWPKGMPAEVSPEGEGQGSLGRNSADFVGVDGVQP